MTWNLAEELGGEHALEKLITEFYDRLFDDLFVGFIFTPFNKTDLIQSQIEWLSANLGDRSASYSGTNLREAHSKLPILVGHFDRRHVILRDLLESSPVPEHVRKEWLSLDESLRDLVVKVGGTARQKILSEDTRDDE